VPAKPGRDTARQAGRCHIEMTTTPGLDYPVGTTYQPDEPPLEMTVEHLQAVNAALTAAGPAPVRHADRDFIIWPVS
jgi:hydroxyacylglutathione hydrolase